MISSHLTHFQTFASALKISKFYLLPVICMFVASIISIYSLAYISTKNDWCKSVAEKISKVALATITPLSILLFLTTYLHLLNLGGLHDQEPIGIAIFGSGSTLLQSHNLAPLPQVDIKEKQAFSTYFPKRPTEPKNLILIIGDALRPDHMSIYGYARETTKNIEQSAKLHQTLVLQGMRSICAESACGLLGLSSSRPLHLIPKKPFTLIDALNRNGYKTHLILSGDHTNFYGLKEAYGTVNTYLDGATQKTRYINDDLLVLDELRKLPYHKKGNPAFFQIHLMSTHGLGLKHKDSEKFTPTSNYYSWPINKKLRTSPSKEESKNAINHYDNGVVQFDSTINEIFEILSQKGYLENSTIAITADHGEMLGEKGFFGHQHSTQEEVLRIPFILQRRGYTKNTNFDWKIASQIDIAPTLLKELDIDVPETWKGIALQQPQTNRFIHFQQGSEVGLYYDQNEDKPKKYTKNLSTNEEMLTRDLESDANPLNEIEIEDSKTLDRIRIEAIIGRVSEEKMEH